jgi:DNA-binding PucR family transcriptional regulator
VGSSGRLDSLATGFAEAELALDTAALFRVEGIVTLEELGPKPLTLGASTAAAKLQERHWQRLAEEGSGGAQIEETMRMYLECNQQVQQVARLLTVHPNTIRYRIGRFRELTRLDIHKTEDLITAWWILNRRQHDRAGG